MGVNQTQGASNISHGLPNRPVLTGAYLAMAIEAGLDLPDRRRGPGAAGGAFGRPGPGPGQLRHALHRGVPGGSEGGGDSDDGSHSDESKEGGTRTESSPSTECRSEGSIGGVATIMEIGGRTAGLDRVSERADGKADKPRTVGAGHVTSGLQT